MLLHDGQIAKQVARHQQTDHPDQGTQHVEKGEFAAGHLGHPRHEGHESSHERHEPRQDDGDAAVFFVEGMGLVKAPSAEKPGLLPLKHPGSDISANGVVHLVAQNGRGQQQPHDQGQVHQARTTHGPDDEQERIAWQKRHDHHAGFHKNDQKQQGIDPGPVLGHEGLQVAIHMEDEIQQLQNNVHRGIILCEALKSSRDFPTKPGRRAPPHTRTPR